MFFMLTVAKMIMVEIMMAKVTVSVSAFFSFFVGLIVAKQEKVNENIANTQASKQAWFHVAVDDVGGRAMSHTFIMSIVNAIKLNLVMSPTSICKSCLFRSKSN